MLQVASSLFDWGGIERYVLYLKAGLEARGHGVDVTLPQGSPLDQRISSSKVHLTLQGKFNPKHALPYLRLFRRQRYDVVHVHFSPDFFWPAYAARLTKQPLTVLTRHVVLPWSAPKVRQYLRLFDHIIPVSNAVQGELLNSGIPANRMTVAKAGCPALEPAAPLMLGTAGRFKVGSFGRLVPEKGVDLLFEAAKLPAARNVEFHVFGSGPLEAEHRRLGEETGVQVHGFRTDVAESMSAMDAIIIPSRWEEAFPYAALEAMSLGKPLVVSRVGGLLEIVSEGETGLAFDKGNAYELAQAVGRLAAAPSEALTMGARGKNLHTQEYTVAKMAERIEAVYTQARRM